MPYNWVQRLRATSSRNEKEDIISECLTAAKLGEPRAVAFLSLVKLALDPFRIYNVKKVPDCPTHAVKDDLSQLSEFTQLLARLMRREVTGNAALDEIVAVGEKFTAEMWDELLVNVIKKDLKAGATTKTFNKLVAGTEWEIPVFEAQLAVDSKNNPKKMPKMARLEPKLDGVRALAFVSLRTNSVTILSRSGKPLSNFGAVARELCNKMEVFKKPSWLDTGVLEEFILDGEMTSNSFQDLMKQAHRKSNVQTDDSVFNIFDVLPIRAFEAGKWSKQQAERTALLADVAGELNQSPNLKVSDGITVNLDSAEGNDIMHRYAQDQVEAGYEGIMIKDLEAGYHCKRSSNWMKWKPVITVDLPVVDMEEGTGRNEGRLGALVCEGVDHGKQIRVNVGSGLSDAQRDEFWAAKDEILGSLVEIKADVITQNQDGSYSLRFPRFMRFRSVDGEKI